MRRQLSGESAVAWVESEIENHWIVERERERWFQVWCRERELEGQGQPHVFDFEGSSLAPDPLSTILLAIHDFYRLYL